MDPDMIHRIQWWASLIMTLTDKAFNRLWKRKKITVQGIVPEELEEPDTRLFRYEVLGIFFLIVFKGFQFPVSFDIINQRTCRYYK
jgi:hypothetical protein